MSAERRQSPRYMVSIASTVTTTAGQSYACEILDLSETGCRIRLQDAVQLWGVVKLATNGDETNARVIWNEGPFAGLWFPAATTPEPEPGFLKRMWRQLRRTGRDAAP